VVEGGGPATRAAATEGGTVTSGVHSRAFTEGEGASGCGAREGETGATSPSGCGGGAWAVGSGGTVGDG